MITATRISLPRADGTLEPYALGDASPWPTHAAPPRTRLAYAAAHVVADPLADVDPWLETRRSTGTPRWRIDATCGTSACPSPKPWTPRNAGWASTGRRAARADPPVAGGARGAGHLDRIACGAGTDHLQPGRTRSTTIIAAYEEQCDFVERHGGRIILMASRALAAGARSADDYVHVYDEC